MDLEYINSLALTFSRKRAVREFKVFVSYAKDDHYEGYIDLLWNVIHESKHFNRDQRSQTKWLFESIGYSTCTVDQIAPTPTQLSRAIKSTFKSVEEIDPKPILHSVKLSPTQIAIDIKKPSSLTWSEYIIFRVYSSLTENLLNNFHHLAEKIFYTNKLISNYLTSFYKYTTISCELGFNRVWVFLFRDRHQLNPEPDDDHSDTAYKYERCKLLFIEMIIRRIILCHRRNMPQSHPRVMMNKLMLQNLKHSANVVV